MMRSSFATSRSCLLAGTAAAVVMTFGPAPVAAQEAEAGSDAIIVTARRIEERLQDVPISITVLNQEQITKQNLVNAQDLAGLTPSLSANTNFGSENSTFAIRGFVQDIGTPPSVGVYFADVVAPRGAASGIVVGDGAGPGTFFDLQNVQVLKGPQGTLFGRNTTGGAVLFVPKKPTGDLEGFIEGSIGNYDMIRVQGALNLPLADTMKLRVAVDRQKREGFLKNTLAIGPQDYSDVDYIAVRASLVADLTPDLENYTVASYTRSDTNGFVQKIIGCNPNTLFGGSFACPQLSRAAARGDGFYDVPNNMSDSRSLLNQWQVINTTTWTASDTLTIKNIASYAELRQNLKTALFGVDWAIQGNPIPFVYIRPAPNLDSAGQSTFTEELQLQGGTADQRLTYQAGAYLEVSDPLGLSGSQTPTLAFCRDFNTLDCTDYLGMQFSQAASVPVNVGSATRTTFKTRFRNVGIYAQASYKLAEALTLTGGIRYTWDKQEVQSTRISYAFPVLPPFTGGPTARCSDASSAPSCTAAVEARSNAPTWLINLDYKPVQDVMIYAKYSRGYRAAGVFPNAPANQRTFNAEKVDTYEIGAKTQFGGALRGTFNIAGFYNNFTNQQLQVGFNPAPGALVPFTTGIVNAGTSRIYGIETDFSITPFAGFRIDGGYTYLNASIRKIAALVSTDPNYLVDAQIRPGDPLVLSPRHKLVLSGAYTLPIDAAIGKVTFGGTVSYVSSQLTAYTYNAPAILAGFGGNLGRLPGRTLLNLNFEWASIAGMPLDLTLFATNVTKKKYYSFVPGLASSGFESAIVGEPRMYGLRLKYTFGR